MPDTHPTTAEDQARVERNEMSVKRLMPACDTDSTMRPIAYMVDAKDGWYVSYADYKFLHDAAFAVVDYWENGNYDPGIEAALAKAVAHE